MKSIKQLTDAKLYVDGKFLTDLKTINFDLEYDSKGEDKMKLQSPYLDNFFKSVNVDKELFDRIDEAQRKVIPFLTR